MKSSALTLNPRRRALLAAAALAAATPLVAAPAPPTGGDVLRQTERKPAPPPDNAAVITVEKTARPALALPAGATVRITTVRVTGNTVVSARELDAVVAGLRGREASLADLQAAADRITALYRERGYLLARAYLPAQEIEAGAVEIAVLEGRIGAVRVSNRSAVSDTTVRDAVAALRPGDPVQAATLERRLLLLNDRAGVGARAALRPGATVGTADLVIEADPTRRVEADAYADNYGNRYTGRWRAGADAGVNSPFGRGDRLDLAGVLGTGLDGWEARQLYGRLAYRTPLGAEGTAAGISYSQLGYHLGREFEDLDAHGTAGVAGAFVSQNLIRSRRLNLAAQLGFEQKRLTDATDAAGTGSRRRLNNVTLAFTADRTDATGITLASLGVTGGRLDIRDDATAAQDAATARTEGGFTAVRAGLKRIQRVNDPLSLYCSGDVQLADGNLASAEKSGAGGAYGVRAYPQGEGIGDASAQFTAEARYDLTGSWRLTAFYDGAWVKGETSPWAPGDNERFLGGPGAGVAWNRAGWTLKAEVAIRADGPAQSEADHRARYWLRAATSF